MQQQISFNNPHFLKISFFIGIVNLYNEWVFYFKTKIFKFFVNLLKVDTQLLLQYLSPELYNNFYNCAEDCWIVSI